MSLEVIITLSVLFSLVLLEPQSPSVHLTKFLRIEPGITVTTSPRTLPLHSLSYVLPSYPHNISGMHLVSHLSHYISIAYLLPRLTVAWLPWLSSLNAETVVFFLLHPSCCHLARFQVIVVTQYVSRRGRWVSGWIRK